MGWLIGAVLGLIVGLVIGLVLAGLRSRPKPEPIPEPELERTVEPVVPEGVGEVIGVLRSSAVVIGPHDQVLQSTSQARTFGLVRGTRVVVPALLDLVRTVRTDRQIRTTELELRRGRGTPSLFLAARVAPIGADLVLILADDRTVARRVEETRRDFVANVSHELKTPIGAISLLSEAVEDAADDPDGVRNFAARMQTESRRLSELVGQIIELSRLQSDNPLLAAVPVSIDKVLADSVHRCREMADRRKVNLTIAGQRGCTVMGDPDHLAQAVSNLVENAVIYSDANAKVAVAARRTEDDGDRFVEITVSDSGIGISPTDVQRIFERFYRVDYARSRANGGTGLGLSIVKHVAAAHGGQVSVWSQLGQGSTFTIRIPEHLARDEYDVRPHHPGPADVAPVTESAPSKTMESQSQEAR